MEKLFQAVTQMNDTMYKNFYKLYYKEKLKIVKWILNVVAVLMFALSYMLLTKTIPNNIEGIVIFGIGVLLIIYPRNSYKKPYKKAKAQKRTIRFSFYQDHFVEKYNGENTEYLYKDIYRVYETKDMICIFMDKRNVEIIDKNNIKQTEVSGLRDLLKSRTQYKTKVV